MKTQVECLRSIAEGLGYAEAPGQGESFPARLGVVPLTLKRTGTVPRWSLHHLSAASFPDFNALFQAAFGQTMEFPLWQWKYGEGRGCSVAAYRDGRLVAHYGGSRRLIAAFGQPKVALQVCDAMVHPKERAVMTKRGAMFQITATFLEIYQCLQGVPLAFGFPNRRAIGLGETLGLYAEVGAMNEVRWPASSRRSHLSIRARPFRPDVQRDNGVLDRLWSLMARDLRDSVLVVRDSAYVRYRYTGHPTRRYQVLVIWSMRTFRSLGVLILRSEGEAVELLDVIAPLKWIPTLIDEARALAARWGKQFLYCWITRQHAPLFASAKASQIIDLDIRIPTNAWVPQAFTAAQLCDRWWLTSGDTDFH
jgi:hypothetical protein